jgi:hypothetical protein
MKIECPNCKLTGQTSDLNIPPEGRYMDCPRCKTNFFVQKEKTANWAETMTDCPECGYSSYSAERFDICPQCGLVAKDYHEKQAHQPTPARKMDVPAEEPVSIDTERMRQELERLEREEMKKRQQRMESTAAPLLREEPLTEAKAVPAQVRFFGWGVVLLALVILAYGFWGLYGYVKITPAEAVTSQFEDPPTPFSLYLTHGLAPILMVMLGFYSLVAGSQFLRLHSWARKGVEAAAWLGVTFIVGRELASLVVSVRRASSDAAMTYYLVEIAGFVLMTTLWAAPLIAAIWYVRKDVFKEEFGE